MQVTIKQMIKGSWQELPLASFKGMSPAEVFLSFDETDTVCSVDTGDGMAYFCGNDKWMGVMKKKGAVMLCRDAAMFYPEYRNVLSKSVSTFSPIERTELTVEAIKCETQGTLSL